MSLPRVEIKNTDKIGSLPDTPNIPAQDLKAKWDKLAQVVADGVNALADALEGGSSDVGVQVPDGIQADPNLQSVLDAMGRMVNALETDDHTHENKETLDGISADVKKKYDNAGNLLAGINLITNTLIATDNSIPTGKAISNAVKNFGGGDMLTSVYDTNADGEVDSATVAKDAQKLGGIVPSAYVRSVNGDTPDENGNVKVGSVNTVNNIAPDENGNIDVGTVKTVNNEKPSSTGNVHLEIPYVNAYYQQKLSTAFGVPEIDDANGIPIRYASGSISMNGVLINYGEIPKGVTEITFDSSFNEDYRAYALAVFPEVTATACMTAKTKNIDGFVLTKATTYTMAYIAIGRAGYR